MNVAGEGARATQPFTKLLNADSQHLRPSDHVVERTGGGFVYGRLAGDDHVLGAAHAIHHVHDGERERGHDFIGDHGFGIGFEQRNVDAVVDMLFVQERDGRGEIQFASE